jgi:hypothetical protein
MEPQPANSFILRNLDQPVRNDWIFWFWIIATAMTLISTFNGYTEPGTTFNAVALVIDIAFVISVQWFVFNWIPRTIRLKMRKRSAN